MSMAKVLRVERVDGTETSQFCLIRVTPLNGADRNTLNLKLVATEGENAYARTIRPNDVSKFRAKKAIGSDSEWTSALLRTLLHAPTPQEHASFIEAIRMTASVTDQSNLTISWDLKKRTTQHLGSVSLPYTEEEQLDLMDLAGEAAQDAQKTADEILNFRQEADLNKEKISKLTEQLKGLEEAKLEHENALLAKFSQLLNAKKLKIRDQQRLLAGASVDPDAAAQVQTTRDRAPRPGAAGKSSIPKRKAGAGPSDTESDSSSDAFEDADMKDAEDRRTPEQSETEDEKELTPPPPPKAIVRRAIGGKAKAAATVPAKIDKPLASRAGALQSSSATIRSKSKSKTPSPKQAAMDVDLPPPRQLPFASKKQSSQPLPKAPSPDDDSETDDEL